MREPYPMSDRHPLIHDRGRGPELVGTRLTVFDLLPDLMNPAKTDADLRAFYAPSLTPERLAAVRAYALEYAERLLPEQRAWEARPEPTNPPEVNARWEEALPRIRARMRRHKQWLAVREPDGSGGFRPTLEEWLHGPEPDFAELMVPAGPVRASAAGSLAGAATDD